MMEIFSLELPEVTFSNIEAMWFQQTDSIYTLAGTCSAKNDLKETTNLQRKCRITDGIAKEMIPLWLIKLGCAENLFGMFVTCLTRLADFSLKHQILFNALAYHLYINLGH